MRIDVQIDTKQLFERMRNGERRLGYATVNALNNTAKRIQLAMREKVQGDFTVRQKQFIIQQVAKIDRRSFANVKRGQAWVEIAVGERPRLLLSKFEKGGERLPFVGQNVAVPVIGGPARPTLARRVPKAWTFEALQFQSTTTRSGKKAIASARQKAYIVPGVGVFERTGRGESRAVYVFVPHLTLDQRLQFVQTARSVADTFFAEEMERETIKALAFAGRPAA